MAFNIFAQIAVGGSNFGAILIIVIAAIAGGWALLRHLKKRGEEAELGGYPEEEKLSEKELKALQKELTEEELEAAGAQEVTRELGEERLVTREAEVEEIEAARAVAAGRKPEAVKYAESTKAAIKREETIAARILRSLQNVKNKAVKQLADIKKGQKDVSKKFYTAQKAGRQQEATKMQQRLAKLQQRQQIKGRFVQTINRLIAERKAGKRTLHITEKSFDKIMKQIEQGASAAVQQELAKQVVGQKAEEAKETAGAQALGALLGEEPVLVAAEKQESAEAAAEKAREKQKEQIVAALIKFDKQIRSELKNIVKNLKGVARTESKDTAVQAALKADIIKNTQNLFISVERAIQTYKSAKQNIVVRRNAFFAISRILSSVIQLGKAEDAKLRQALRAIPNDKVSGAILKRLDAAIILAEKLLPQLRTAEQELNALQAG